MGSGEEAVSGVERALLQRRRRKNMVRVATRAGLGGALALAAAGVVLLLRGERSDQALKGTASRAAIQGETSPGDVQREAAEAPSRDPHGLWVMEAPSRSWRVETGTRVSAPKTSSLLIASDEGTVLTLDPDSTLTVVSVGATRRFDLLRGAVYAQVSKLGRGERFIIDTADAEVEVRGTAFRVETGVASSACPEASAGRTSGTRAARPVSSRVTVDSGVVSVSAGGNDVRLHPGESWPMPCRRASHAPIGASSRALSVTTLRAQNELFASAVAARNAGETARALALFDRFIGDYPQSSLTEGAMAARMRLLAGADPARAAEAAASYLARFPDGVARTEAATLMPTRGGP